MKDKRIWIVIGCILVIGTGVTHYTKYYVDSQETAAGVITEAAPGETAAGAPSPASSSEAGQGEPGGERSQTIAADVSVPKERSLSTAPSGRQERPAAAAPVKDLEQEAAAEETVSQDMAASGEAADSEVQVFDGDATAAEPISPLTGGRVQEEKSALTVDYRQRLMDLDAQIQRIREQETDSNIYSIKTSSETELKMWESELNTIYNALLEILPPEEAAGLAAEQQEWMKSRDTKAAESSGKNSTTVEGFGYAATLVSLTRERAYELAGRYEKANGVQVLPEKETAGAVSGQ